MFMHYRHLQGAYTIISISHAAISIKNKHMLIVKYLLLHVSVKFWCKLPEDGDNAETRWG